MKHTYYSIQPQMTFILGYQSEGSRSIVPYPDVFRGIRTGVPIALIFFWMPCSASYIIFGWWYAIVYSVALMIATIVVGLFIRLRVLIMTGRIIDNKEV